MSDAITDIVIDRFLSTSGKYQSYLTQTFMGDVQGLNAYHITVARVSDGKIVKVVRLCYDNPAYALEEWDKWKSSMLEAPLDEEKDEPASLGDALGPAGPEGEEMPTLRPVGPRIIVEEILTEDIDIKRAEAAGLTIPDSVRKATRSSRGTIIAIGDDPLLRESFGLKEGMIVWYAPTAGLQKFVAGRRLRTLEAHEITDVEVE